MNNRMYGDHYDQGVCAVGWIHGIFMAKTKGGFHEVSKAVQLPVTEALQFLKEQG